MASCTVVAGRPEGTGTSWRAKSCLPWYSRRSMRGEDSTIAARMALPKDIKWVTFDVYGTLIDWEKGVLDAFQKEAQRDGFTIDSNQVIALFHEISREVEGGSYELYAEVLRRTA